MKKILGIVGSPRRNGNTHVLVSQALEGAKAAGAETELVLLGDLRIEECDGCHACWKTGQCTRKDDMTAFYDGISGSDAIIFGTPVYWYGPTALMKACIDRFVFFNAPATRPKVRGKAAAIIVPFEEDNPETSAGVVEFFEKSLAYLEMKLVGRVIVPGVTRPGEVRRKADALRQAAETGRLLA